jgi:hypothetical protein
MKSSLQSRTTFPNNRATHAHLHGDTLPISAACSELLYLLHGRISVDLLGDREEQTP